MEFISKDDSDLKIEPNLISMSKFIPKLNPYHTHFILVDDGSNYESGREIKFRTRLEDRLRIGDLDNFLQIPIVLIVVEGGENTLKTIAESVEKGIQVLIFKVFIKQQT